MDRVVIGVLRSDIAWSFAAVGDGYGVNGLPAVGSRDHQFTAPSGRLTHLLHGAQRHSWGHRASHREVATAACGGDTTDGNVGASAKTIVALNEFLVVRSRACRRSRVGVVGHHLVAQGSEAQGVTRCADPGSRAAVARVTGHA